MEGTECLNIDGLRVVIRHAPGATECCGLTFNAGSRDETTPEDYGLAHFVEHTIFKGTPRRSGNYILNRMEAVGGELNAFTTKEETTIYTMMPAGNLRRAVNLLFELAAESSFPAKGLSLEREVVCDEIDSYLDSPADAAYDLFDEEMFADNPLAHNILGTRQTVRSFTSERCQRYLSEMFTPDNAVFFYLGPEEPQKVVKLLVDRVPILPEEGVARRRVRPDSVSPFQEVRNVGSHQSHTVMGALIGGLHDPLRPAISLAVNILGGPGMNSLLNMELRERRGLVYTVEASTALYSDCGTVNIYFGCDPHDRGRCLSLIATTLNRAADTPLTAVRLQAAKRQYLGQITLGYDNREQLAISSGRALLHGLHIPSLSRTAELINNITPETLQSAFQLLAAAPQQCLSLS